jgi:DNA-directed RNA polymerase subunit beta'
VVHGEVTKPETINYRTFKPERDGLFCAKIFGPSPTGSACAEVQAHEAPRRRVRQVRRRGDAVARCAASAWATSSWRRPVSHVWFFKGLPSRIGHLLDISLRDIERILYFEAYVVIDSSDPAVEAGRDPR